MYLKKIKKIILVFLLSLGLVMPNLSAVLAISFSPNKFASDLEKRYNSAKSANRDASQQNNVTNAKRDAPSMNLTFNPVAPEVNKPITATAFPINFANQVKDQYYTWYIKHEKCKLQPTKEKFNEAVAEDENIATCDVDGDSRVTINDWKVEAMRIIASNNFNMDRAQGSASDACLNFDFQKCVDDWKIARPDDNAEDNCNAELDDLGCNSDSVYEVSPTNALDDDGYVAVFGGESQRPYNTTKEALTEELQDIRADYMDIMNNSGLDETTLAGLCDADDGGISGLLPCTGSSTTDKATNCEQSDVTCQASSGARSFTISMMYDACFALENDGVTYANGCAAQALNIANINPFPGVDTNNDGILDAALQTTTNYNILSMRNPNANGVSTEPANGYGYNPGDNTNAPYYTDSYIASVVGVCGTDEDCQREAQRLYNTNFFNIQTDTSPVKLPITNTDDAPQNLYYAQACRNTPSCSRQLLWEYAVADYCSADDDCILAAQQLGRLNGSKAEEFRKLSRVIIEILPELWNIIRNDLEAVAELTQILIDFGADVSALDPKQIINTLLAGGQEVVDLGYAIISWIDKWFIVPRCYVHDFANGTDYEMRQYPLFGGRFTGSFSYAGCQHLFPRIPIYTTKAEEDKATPEKEREGFLDWMINNPLNSRDVEEDNKDNDDDFWFDWERNFEWTGDGNFKSEEEKFWRTDPNNPNTAGNGNVDEANVVGLGQNKFTWTYQDGDQIGVAIEGTSGATKYDDNSVKVMWALSKNVFDTTKEEDDDELEIKVGGITIPVAGKCSLPGKAKANEYIKGYNVKIPTGFFLGNWMNPYRFEIGLNGCLEANLVDPMNGGQSERLDLSLSSFPANPLNNTQLGGRGDTLTVSSAINNTNIITDLDQAFYKWKIEWTTAEDAGSAKWYTLPRLARMNLVPQTTGKGLTNIKMNLNFSRYENTNGETVETYKTYASDVDPNNVLSKLTFLRITLNVSDNIYSNNYHEGTTNIIIPIYSTDNQLIARPVEARSECTTLSSGETFPCPEGELPTGTFFAGSRLSVPTDIDGEQEEIMRCKYASSCSIAPNEIIRLEGPTDNDFVNPSWQIDGKNIDDPTTFCGKFNATECSNIVLGGSAEKVLYFPITKQPGENHIVTMKLTDKKSQKDFTLSKTFNVVEPKVKVFPTDNLANTNDPNQNIYVHPVQIGTFYNIFTGQKEPDYDYANFEVDGDSPVFANLDSAVTLEKISNLTWSFDGEEINENSLNLIKEDNPGLNLKICDPNNLTAFPDLESFCKRNAFMAFSATRDFGESYQISASGTYTQSNETKKALASIWGIGGVNNEDFYETDVSDSVNITVVAPMVDVDMSFAHKAGKTIATLFAGFPTYLAFLFKMILLVASLLFFLKLILSFSPKSYGK